MNIQQMNSENGLFHYLAKYVLTVSRHALLLLLFILSEVTFPV